MANNQLIIDADKYHKLSDGLSAVYDDFNSFLSKSKRIRDDYLFLDQELKKLPSLNMACPNFEREINQVIENKGDAESPKDIFNTVSTYYFKMVQIDRETQEIKKAYQKLQQLPDRFGKADLTDKLSVFLQNIQSVSINDLDKINDEVIPNIKKALEQIGLSFANENATISNIKQSALDLISRLESHKNSQDRYGLKTICSKGVATLNNIISNPNYNNLASDATTVQKIKDILDQCEASFKKEEEYYLELKDIFNLSSGGHFWSWREDIEPILKIADEALSNIYVFPQTTQDTDSFIANMRKNKEDDLAAFCGLYEPKVLEHFKEEIEKIEKNCVYKDELNALRVTIDEYIKEKKKDTVLKVLKWVGIAIGSALLIWLIYIIVTFVIEYWIWFAVIGGILLVGFLISLFKS